MGNSGGSARAIAAAYTAGLEEGRTEGRTNLDQPHYKLVLVPHWVKVDLHNSKRRLEDVKGQQHKKYKHVNSAGVQNVGNSDDVQNVANSDMHNVCASQHSPELHCPDSSKVLFQKSVIAKQPSGEDDGNEEQCSN